MDNILKTISVAISSIFTWSLYFLGGSDLILYSLVMLMTLDYITGVLSAFKENRFSIQIGFWGLTKKFMIIVLVAVAVALDGVFNTPGAIRGLIIVWYSANEGLSIIQNADVIGVPVPSWLSDKLQQVKDNDEEI